MKINRTLRRYWHDLYYGIVAKRGIEFAMRCRDVVQHIDLPPAELNLPKTVRVHLHLSLCQACASYAQISRALHAAIHDLVAGHPDPADFALMKAELLKRHASPAPK